MIENKLIVPPKTDSTLLSPSDVLHNVKVFIVHLSSLTARRQHVEAQLARFDISNYEFMLDADYDKISDK